MTWAMIINIHGLLYQQACSLCFCADILAHIVKSDLFWSDLIWNTFLKLKRIINLYVQLFCNASSAIFLLIYFLVSNSFDKFFLCYCLLLFALMLAECYGKVKFNKVSHQSAFLLDLSFQFLKCYTLLHSCKFVHTIFFLKKQNHGVLWCSRGTS